MVQFIGLPKPGDGVNSTVDFSGVQNAIQGFQQASDRKVIYDQQQADKQQARAREDEDRNRKRFGALAQAIDNERDPARRTKMWQMTLERAKKTGYDLNGLSPEELDPMTGPRLMMAEAGIVVDPLDRQLKQAELERARAQTAQASNRQPPAPPIDEIYDHDTGAKVKVFWNGKAWQRIGGTAPTTDTAKAPQVEQFTDETGRPYQAMWNGREWQRIGGYGQPKLTKAQEAVDKEFGKTYAEDFVSGGAADQQKNVNQITEIADRLEGVTTDPKTGQKVPVARREELTGTITGNTPDMINQVINPSAIDARDKVEEVVQRNLRVILGAQFTNEEGKRLIARAFNPALDEKTNAKRLRALGTAMEQALRAKAEAAAYYEQNGTLVGFKGRTNFSISDFEAAIEGGNSGRTAAQQGNAARPKNKQEFDSLPSGTVFIDPTGQRRVKP